MPPHDVRLLAPGDPILLGRDREALIADPALRKKVWAAVGGAGVVLSRGEPVALWRARKQGKRLEVTLEAFGEVPDIDGRGRAARAPSRLCDGAAVGLSVHSGG